MSVDTRARRAADAVHATTSAIDPWVQIAELKRADRSRRRASRVAAVLGGFIVVASAGWLAISQVESGGGVQPQPMSSPSAVDTDPAPDLRPGPSVGGDLAIPLEARAPKAWTVSSDTGYVSLDADGQPGGAGVQIGGPIDKVWSHANDTWSFFSVSGSCCEISPYESYGEYLLGHPSLVLLDARVVTIDGRQFQQLTFRVKNDAPSRPGHDGVTLARYEGVEADQAWREVEQGSVFTDTILDLEPGTARKPTLVITAAGAETAEEQLEQDAALELLLSTMRLPE